MLNEIFLRERCNKEQNPLLTIKLYQLGNAKYAFTAAIISYFGE